MKLVRFALAVVVLGSVAGLAYVAQQIEGSGATQVTAAQDFLEALTPEQKKQAAFAFDSPERFNWNFVPLQDKDRKSTRKGLPLESMSAEQKKKAMQLLKSGTSMSGADTVQLIMSLEGILRDSEKMGAMVRNPDWYFVTVFGTPSKTGAWGWRFEGHHLSINITLEGTQVVSTTPFFFGANPALIKSGPKQGMKVLAGAHDLGAKLFASLDDAQKKVAHQAKDFPEPGQKEKKPQVGAPVGLVAGKMTAAQKELLMQIVEDSTNRMPKDVAAVELKAVREGGVDSIYFAFSGSPEEGKGRTYRIQGPAFVVEFLNIQADGNGNPNNHIHNSLRRLKGDFGIN